jgi:hypothetical protein
MTLDNFQREGTKCWPRQKTLAEIVGCTPRSLRRYLSELIAEGIVKAEKTAFAGPLEYRLQWGGHQCGHGCPHCADTDVLSMRTSVSAHKANKTENQEIHGASAEDEKPVALGICRSCRGKGRILTQAVGWMACTPCRGTGREQTRRFA